MNCASPDGMTVGTVVPIRNAARPAAGSVCSAWLSRTVPCDAFAVSISGASPVTVTFSVIVPTSRSRSSTRNDCVAMRMLPRSIVLYPWSDAFTVYVPGSTDANAYSPRSLVTVDRLSVVWSLVSVTSTPGMTPPLSLTDPRRPPWNPCPNTPVA